jgi:hypothetical protein
VDEEDEVLKALAEELGRFVDLIGGPAYAHLLLPSLESIAAAEETVVREAAVASIGKISAVLSVHQVEESLVPLIKRLAAAEWFTSKSSACALFVHAYGACKALVRDELRKYDILNITMPSILELLCQPARLTFNIFDIGSLQILRMMKHQWCEEPPQPICLYVAVQLPYSCRIGIILFNLVYYCLNVYRHLSGKLAQSI